MVTQFVVEKPPEGVKKTGVSDEQLENTEHLYSTLSNIFKDLPEGNIGIFNHKTKEMIDMGSANSLVDSQPYKSGYDSMGVLEPDQIIDDIHGVSHKVNFHSIVNMINSEPDVAQNYAMRAELSVGYGYRFVSPTVPPELSLKPNAEFPLRSTEFWHMWARYVNYDLFLRQSTHSLFAMGNTWGEKVYDSRGLGPTSWGIQGLRTLSPDIMHNVIDGSGNILYYVQTIVDTDRMFGDNFTIKYKTYDDKMKEFSQKAKDTGQKFNVRNLSKHKVIYTNYNAYYDDTQYGFGTAVPFIPYVRSKIMIQKRLLRSIDNASSSMMVFKYGTEDYAVGGKEAKAIFARIKNQPSHKFLLLPWYFDVEEHELGKNLPNMEPYLKYFQESVLNGAGMPPVLTGRAGSAEGAKIQQEFLVRQLMYMQKHIANVHARQLFPEVLIGDPLNTTFQTKDMATPMSIMRAQHFSDVINVLKKEGESSPNLYVTAYPYVAPRHFINTPMLAFNTMETVADRRLRHDVYLKHGVLSETEVRRELEYDGTVSEADQNIIIRQAAEKIKLEREKIKSQEKLAKTQTEAQQKMLTERAQTTEAQAKKPAKKPAKKT
jgi:hypothetical protein